MALALDLGSSEFRSLRWESGTLVARRTAAAYTVVDDTLLHRRLFEQMSVPTVRTDSQLLAIGHHAGAISRVLHLPRVHLLSRGEFSVQDPVARQIGQLLLEAVLPVCNSEKEVVYCTLPGMGRTHARRSVRSRRFFEQLLRLRFAAIREVHPATAVVLAEMSTDGITGFGMSVGSESVSLSLCRSGQPELEWMHPHGARSIHRAIAHNRHRYQWDAAGDRFLDLRWAEELGRAEGFSIAAPRTGDERLLTEGYGKLLREALRGFFGILQQCRPAVSQAGLPMVVAGGPTQLPGFADLLCRLLAESPLAGTIRDPRVAALGPYSISRGLLIRAELEEGHRDRSVA